jgi:zinc/manganese transport system substrate-binding protein
MHRRHLIAILLAVPAERLRAQPPPILVTATFTILADLVSQIGGDRVVVASLVGTDGDPHTYQPRPSDLTRLATSTVLVENGLNLEGWMTRLAASAGFHGKLIVTSAGLPTRNFQEGGKTVIDPHVWQDPRLAVRMVAAIAAGLTAADPAGADAYRERAASFTADIQREDQEIAAAMAAIPADKRQIITSHDAFGYYGARYGITFQAAQGISTEDEPTPRELAKLAAQIRREHIRAVFVENMTDPRIAGSLAREAGAIVGGKVYSDSLSPPDGPAPTYLAMLRHNTKLFTEAMSKQ